jgi:Electron transfer DM13
MKQIVISIVIFICGAVSYSLLNPWLSSLLEPKEETPTPEVIEDTKVIGPTTTPTIKDVAATKPKPEPVIDAAGGLHDGPFSLFDKNDTKVEGSVEIIRSPEETLLQFKGITFTHGSESFIYIANDRKATKYLNVGKAQLNQGALIYGLPLDVDLSPYKYILIYNDETKSPEFYATLE